MPAAPRRLIDLRPLRHDTAALLLVMLVLVDLAVIALHLAYTLLGVPAGVHFDLGVDRSYGEFLLYIKFGWIAVLGVVLARRRRAAVFAAIAAGSLVLLLEDALILHERIGWHLNERILAALPGLSGWGILSVQLGELLWLGVVAVVVATLFVISYLRAGTDDRRDAAGIVLFFAVLVFFAVVVDTVHSLFALGSLGDVIFTVIEDGGEIVALTPAVALAFALATDSARSGSEQAVTTP
ncbi:hypothetical protein WDU99_08420 [Microbacterium sp. Mu-80]|uniref:Uncharacterized protein n=1 Tax=Microbacterium bandirmense TaxID=3122050 RepID=A0ABU8LCB7_9MICO